MKTQTIKPQKQEQLETLAQALMEVQSPEEMLLFLEDLCTPAELESMADRWLIVPLIKADIPYRQIYQRTGVSTATISRVARCIRSGSGLYNTIFARVHHQ